MTEIMTYMLIFAQYCVKKQKNMTKCQIQRNSLK